MGGQLKRLNELECISIVKEFHDSELSKDDPDEFLMWLCMRLIRLIEARHKADK